MDLAADLVKYIYERWLLKEQYLVLDILDRPMNPFQNWNARVTPRFWPRKPQQLTAQKLATATYFTFHGLIRLNRWPGYAITKIFEGDTQPPPQTNQIGTLEIQNTPSRDNAAPASGVGAFLGDLPTTQRWLRCYEKIMAIALPKKSFDRVTDDVRFLAKPEVHRYSFPCESFGRPDRVDLFIYPTANAGSTSQLDWQRLFESMTIWLIEVAQGRDGGSSTRILTSNRLVAEISIYLQRRTGVDNPGVATS
ncbi:MAG: hypothetical protein Q9219_005750 [cf. Caloplaca sp. 3 TL-2023]